MAFEEQVASGLVVPGGDGLFSNGAQLELQPLVEMVLERNPSVSAMTAAWQAVSQRYSLTGFRTGTDTLRRRRAIVTGMSQGTPLQY